MKHDLDTIIIESRFEIHELTNILETYQREHGNNDTVQNLLDILEIMDMCW